MKVEYEKKYCEECEKELMPIWGEYGILRYICTNCDERWNY